jgi:hypothetical protein
MTANLALTQYALRRVLFHLSEEEQGKQPRYRTHNGCFQARAAARVIVKHALRTQEQLAEAQWREVRDAQ